MGRVKSASVLLFLFLLISLIIPFGILIQLKIGGIDLSEFSWVYKATACFIVLFIISITFFIKFNRDVKESLEEEDTKMIINSLSESDQETEVELESIDTKKIISQVLKTDVKNSENAIKDLAVQLISLLGSSLNISQGSVYVSSDYDGKKVLSFAGGYAYHKIEDGVFIDFGEGLTGQSAKAQKSITLDSVPEGYITIFSGLGESTPKHLVIIPIVSNKITYGVIEMASFQKIETKYLLELEKELEKVAQMIKTIIESDAQ